MKFKGNVAVGDRLQQIGRKAGEVMKWQKFEDKQRDSYIHFIRKQCGELFSKLNNFEKSLFYHYWHKTLNEHICYALMKDDDILAFISTPEWKTKHWIRWPESNALWGNYSYTDLPMLPSEFKECWGYRTLMRQESFDQAAFVCNLRNYDFKTVTPINNELDFYKVGTEMLPEIERLLDKDDRNNDSEIGFYEEYYLPVLINNLKDNHNENYGIGYYATEKGKKNPIAVVFYEGFEMPLTGTPCMLICDVVVKKSHRKKRVATSLQAYAYEELKKEGVNWVLGNIMHDNESSLKQASALGRFPFAMMVGVKEVYLV